MTVEQMLHQPDHDPIDDEISISRKKLGTGHLATVSSTLIQSSYRRSRERTDFIEMKESALVVQCATRMYKSRTQTIRFVRDGQDSPLVTLRGKYLCGKPVKTSEGRIPEVVHFNEVVEQDTTYISTEASNPRRTGRKQKVARLIPDNHSDKDPLLDPSGLPTAPHQLNRLTLDNTKRNSLYKTVTIKVEDFPIGLPRPGSPQRAWSKKPLHKKTELQLTDEETEDLGLRWNKKLVFLDELKPKEPLDSGEICIPIKPILRRPRTPKMDSTLHSMSLEPAEILVKKVLYADEADVDYGVEDIMQDCADLPPTKKGRRKKAKGRPAGTPSNSDKSKQKQKRNK